MIASMPTAVLPVLRSPMMSSRWPRPIGVIASIALMPVCSGSHTGCRSATPGAMISTGRRCLVTIGPLPSSGLPSGSTTRPKQLVAHRHAQQPARAADFVAFGDLQVVAQDDDADGVLFEVERQADRAVGELDHLLGHHAGEAVHAGDAVADFQHAADVADVDLRRELLDFLLDDGGDFVAIEFHECSRSVGQAVPDACQRLMCQARA